MTSGYQAFDNVSWRPLLAGDRHAVYEVQAAAEVFADGVVEVDEADIEADWSRPDLDLARMSLGGFAEGRLVAYAVVFQGRVDAAVHPDYRGRGLGAHLARWTWQVARSEGRERVGQTVSDNESSAAALFQALGYERGHTAWVLRAPLATGRPFPPLPPGYRFRAYVPGDDDREMYELIDQAFSEWRNADSEAMGFENWVAYCLQGVRPDFIVLLDYAGGDADVRLRAAPAGASALDDAAGRLVGVAVGSDHEQAGEGSIEQIAVRREHRGRGLGGALLAESLRRFQEAGRTSAGVSTDSRTGALGLYEHAGMTVERSYTRWVKRGLSDS